jgi:PhnB protein
MPPNGGAVEMSSKSVPDSYRATPYLICRDASSALEWYRKAFGAVEQVRLADPSGKVMHAEIRVGESPIMLADEFPDMGYRSPESIGGTPVSILLYVDDVDRVFSQAIRAGATETMVVSDQFDGDRRGTLTDPYGHVWLLASRTEDLSFSELQARFQKLMKGET